VGTGEALNEIATGYAGAWPEFKDDSPLRESVRLMRELWRGRTASISTVSIRLKGASITMCRGRCRSMLRAADRRWPKYAGTAGDASLHVGRARSSTRTS